MLVQSLCPSALCRCWGRTKGEKPPPTPHPNAVHLVLRPNRLSPSAKDGTAEKDLSDPVIKLFLGHIELRHHAERVGGSVAKTGVGAGCLRLSPQRVLRSRVPSERNRRSIKYAHCLPKKDLHFLTGTWVGRGRRGCWKRIKAEFVSCNYACSFSFPLLTSTLSLTTGPPF